MNARDGFEPAFTPARTCGVAPSVRAGLRRLSKDEKADLPAAVRELVYKGRIMMAVERYRQRKASLGRAAELAGVPLGEMIEILADYGGESNLEIEDYRKGLQNLRKVW